MILEELLWALFKTDAVMIALLIIYGMATWGSHITTEVKATIKYKIVNGLFKTVITLFPILLIGIIWV